MKKLFLLRGLPGSGKTTIAKFLYSLIFPSSERGISVGHYAADMYFEEPDGYKFDYRKLKTAHNHCQTVCRTFMENSCNIILIHNTFTRKREMKPYFDLANEHGYEVNVMTVENYHGGKTEHGVPDIKLRQMAERFEINLNVPKKKKLQHLIQDLKNVEQSPEWHPEGCVYTHTAMVTGQLLGEYPHEPELHWAGLFHDFGKIECSKWDEEKEKWTAYGHDIMSCNHWKEHKEDVDVSFTSDMLPPLDTVKVDWLIRNHMRIKNLQNMKWGSSKAAEFISHPWFKDLEKLNDADNMKKLFKEHSEENRKSYIVIFEEWLNERGLLVVSIGLV